MTGVTPVCTENGASGCARRTVAGACLVTAVAAAIAGCGTASPSSGHAGGGRTPSGGATLSAARAVAIAGQAARRITSLTLTETMVMRGLPGGAGGAGTGLPGAGSLPGLPVNGSMAFTVHLKMQLKPDVRGEISMRFGTRNHPFTMTEILTPRAIYIKAPGMLPTRGKPWAEINVANLPGGTKLSTIFSKLQGGNPLVGGPSAEAKLLAGAEHLRVVRHQIVRGVPTTEYGGTLSFSKFLSLMPGASRGFISTAPALLRRAGLPFQIWIDSQHQVRKLILTMGFRRVSMRMTMNVTSINAPVTITPPPASEVTTAPVP